MDSATECKPGPVEPCSAPVDARDVGVSPSDRHPLRSAADFRHVLSKGPRVTRGAVTVVAAAGPEPIPRVGLVTGRRVGNAVERNRAKRRLRHALAGIQLEQRMDYVVIADRGVLEETFEDLKSCLQMAVEKLR